MNADDALIRLGESTAEAVAGVLQMFARRRGVGAVVAGHGAEQAAEQAVQGLAVPAVVAERLLRRRRHRRQRLRHAARRRARARRRDDGRGARGGRGAELSELELSAVAEAMNQMMAAAAIATSAVLGTGGRDRPAETKRVIDEAEAVELLRADDAARAAASSRSAAAVPARAARPERVRGAHDRALDELRRDRHRVPTDDAAAGRARCAPSLCASGPSSAARGCRPASSSAARRRGRRARPPGRRAHRPLRQRHALRHRPADRGRGGSLSSRATSGSRATRRRLSRAGAAPLTTLKAAPRRPITDRAAPSPTSIHN